MAEPTTPAEVLAEIHIFDEWGFQVQPYKPWLLESRDAKKDRLEKNQAYYREFLKNGCKFPQKVNKARLDEFKQLQAMGKIN